LGIIGVDFVLWQGNNITTGRELVARSVLIPNPTPRFVAHTKRIAGKPGKRNWSVRFCGGWQNDWKPNAGIVEGLREFNAI